jgi:hypothetical protein
MTQVTNRLSKQDIINIAKRDYEASQRSMLPSEIVNLPSKGQLYPESSPLRNGQLEMRYMTAYDEDILTNASYIKEGVVLDKLIDSLIVTPGITISDIAQVDRDALLIQARILSYGAEYPVIVTDPSTGQTTNKTVDLTQLTHKPFDLQSDENGEFSYRVQILTQTYDIKFAFLSIEQTKKISENNTISDLLKNMIRQVDDSRDAQDIESFIRFKFLAREAKQFRTYVFDNMPGVNLEYTFQGETGGTFSAGFQIGSDFFWF